MFIHFIYNISCSVVVTSCSDSWFMFLYARLIQESSYFHGLLSGSFRLESSLCSVCYVIVCSSCCVTWICNSESGRDHISIEWNLETFLNLMRCIYDCALDITSTSFLPLFDVSSLSIINPLLSLSL